MCQCKDAGGGYPSLENVENSESLPQSQFPPAGAAAIPFEERAVGTAEERSPCADIRYPFTEEGKPACLSRACPKNSYCKECCKDWSKE